MTPLPIPLHWHEHLTMLAARFSHLGFGPDLAALTVAEAWGLYSYLTRLAGLPASVG
jgi:hypothetical protein